MVGGGNPYYLKFWVQLNPIGAKTLIFSLAKKVQLTLIVFQRA